MDAIGEAGKGVRRETSAQPFVTGGGLVHSTENVEVDIPQLSDQPTECTVLPGCPRALELGRRCAVQGFGFYWRPFAQEPQFVDPHGNDITVHTDAHYVPILRVPKKKRADRVPVVMPIVAASDEDSSASPVEIGSAHLVPFDPDVYGDIVELDESSIQPVCEEVDREDASEIKDLVTRVVDRERLATDAEADAIVEKTGIKLVQTSPADEDREYCLKCENMISPTHLALHLPRIPGCPGCDHGKVVSRPHRRRK